jgi:hypothetical protein
LCLLRSALRATGPRGTGAGRHRARARRRGATLTALTGHR